jgi:excinuclease ABC subunit A
VVPGKHRRLVGWEEIDKVINIDQSPIGRTPRSNPATYIGVFDHIRTLYSQLPEARVRGYKPGRFSFNVRGGRCEACAGEGQIKIEMHFLPDVYVTCEQCKGKRYNRETLEVKFKGRSIADVLEMSIDQALEFFKNLPVIARHLQTISDVGLGYMRMGQPAPTLSGGEAQRVKLASELSKRATGRTFYMLDEPTTGLHFEDIRKLLAVLERLVAAGNTVLVIEHNLDVIKTADWIIDLGPEGGDAGGEVVAAGPPETVAAESRSHTGHFLAEVLGISRAQRREPVPARA